MSLYLLNISICARHCCWYWIPREEKQVSFLHGDYILIGEQIANESMSSQFFSAFFFSFMTDLPEMIRIDLIFHN